MNEGMKFSLLYLDRSKSLKDSKRFRKRLSAFFYENLNFHDSLIGTQIEMEVGAEVNSAIYNFIVNTNLRDLLDSITIIYETLCKVQYGRESEKWKEFVERVLLEENLGYRLDKKCGVHYFVDEEFERNRYSTLLVLEDQRYTSIRTAYDMAYQYLDDHPMDIKGAVRSIFESIEILVKQMVETQNLNKWVVENTLKEKCSLYYKSDPTAQEVMTKMFDGFAQWVDSIHNYRHGQADAKPVAPPINIAIYALSSGTAFLRWLIEINNSFK